MLHRSHLEFRHLKRPGSLGASNWGTEVKAALVSCLCRLGGCLRERTVSEFEKTFLILSSLLLLSSDWASVVIFLAS